MIRTLHNTLCACALLALLAACSGDGSAAATTGASGEEGEPSPNATYEPPVGFLEKMAAATFRTKFRGTRRIELHYEGFFGGL